MRRKHHYLADESPVIGMDPKDNNELFILRTCSKYLLNLIKTYPQMNQNYFEFLQEIVGTDVNTISDHLINSTRSGERDSCMETLSESYCDPSEFSRAVVRVLKKLTKLKQKKLNQFLISFLEKKIGDFQYKGESELESKLSTMKVIFNLTDCEAEFCKLPLVISLWDSAETFFVTNLRVPIITGRKYLKAILDIGSDELTKIMNGTLQRAGLIDIDKYSFELKDHVSELLDRPADRMLSDFYFTKVNDKAIPLQSHLLEPNQLNFALDLLREKHESPTHLLIYGPPGTGKTSFARGLVHKLGIPGYEIVGGEDNKSEKRRAALTACLNMTNTGQGSVIIIDEADNILNTEGSWFRRGETQDKGWLNQLLDQTGTRMIWITNDISCIEGSVMRRFAFNIHFKALGKQQRFLIWNSVLSQNGATGIFTQQEMKGLSSWYKVSAGVMDLAVKKALEISGKDASKVKSDVIQALDSHQALLNGGYKTVKKDEIEDNYSLEGLNIRGDLDAMMARLREFDAFLRNKQTQTAIRNMNLLFYGPPGTGKSELARYIARELKREIVCKRASDIFDSYVGMSERYIKEAFEEAERDEAILIIDEADTLLFTRERAQRSWEISFTNEFLTQMERFRGILVCTTNRLAEVDSAAMRRFNQKIEFKYLSPKGNTIFFERLLSPLLEQELDEKGKAALISINDLAPGDFRVVRDRFYFETKDKLSADMMIQALKEESDLKRVNQAAKAIGF